MNIYKNLLNFRDLGGMKTVDGKTVRFGRLFRAAQPVGLSDDEIAELREHNLRFIFDLRTLREITDVPVDEIEGVTYTHIDIMGENAAQEAAPGYWMELFRENPSIVESAFTKTYQEFATSPSSIAGYGALIKAFANSGEGAILFHCAAGKDRTGFAAAIILKLLGVSEEDIFEDYLKTIEYQILMNDHYVKRGKENGFSDEQIKMMGDIFSVKTGYLQAAFKSAEDTFGSFENYVTYGLGLSLEEIEQLKKNYLQ